MTAYLGLECIRCGAHYEHGTYLEGCPACATERSRSNLTCRYDYDALRRTLDVRNLANDLPGLWRWHRLLPVAPEHIVSLREGDTPVIRCDRLGRAWGLDDLYVKDETRNPTWSYKDRLNTVAISAARQHGSEVIAVSSTGNHGASTAAYAARAGMPCVVFTTATVPQTMRTLMQSYGAFVLAMPTLADRWRLMAEAVERFGWYPVSNGSWPPVGSTPYGMEGYKTIAFELFEHFGAELPERVFVPTAFGDGLYGVWKGFHELRLLGVTDRVPRMVASEPFGPLANALAKNLDEGEPVPSGSTVAFSIGSPLNTHQGLTAIRQSDGSAYAIDDDATMAAQGDLARHEGIFAEASSTTALAAVKKALEQGDLDPQERVCVVLSSTGLKDTGATHERLGPVPQPEPSLDAVLDVLEGVYGFQPAERSTRR